MTLDSRGFVLYSADIQERGTIAGADHQIKTNSGSVYEIADYASNNALEIKDIDKEYILELEPTSTS